MIKPTPKQLRQLAVFYVAAVAFVVLMPPHALNWIVFEAIIAFVVVPCLVLNGIRRSDP
jgi:hypothetical protein